MKICFAPSGSSVATRGLIVSLGALALAAFLVGNHSYDSKLEYKAKAQTPLPAVRAHRGEEFYYFRSGQCMADLRTLVAVCRYLVDPDLA
jgi:hypothetical protein